MIYSIHDENWPLQRCAHMTSFSTTIGFVEKAYLNVSQSVRDDVVASSVVYPRTSNLEDKAEETFYLHAQSPNYTHLQNQCLSSVHLRPLNGIVDVRYILESFSRLHESMLFSRVDCIVIYKGGINLIKIVLTEDGIRTRTNDTGRSAYIEIDSLRLRLMNIFKENEYKTLKGIGMIAVPVLFSFVSLIIAGFSFWNRK